MIDQGTLDVYAVVSGALVIVFSVLVIISLLNTTGWMRVPHRVMATLLVAALLSIAAAVVAALLTVSL